MNRDNIWQGSLNKMYTGWQTNASFETTDESPHATLSNKNGKIIAFVNPLGLHLKYKSGFKLFHRDIKDFKISYSRNLLFVILGGILAPLIILSVFINNTDPTIMMIILFIAIGMLLYGYDRKQNIEITLANNEVITWPLYTDINIAKAFLNYIKSTSDTPTYFYVQIGQSSIDGLVLKGEIGLDKKGAQQLLDNGDTTIHTIYKISLKSAEIRVNYEEINGKFVPRLYGKVAKNEILEIIRI